MQRNLLDFIGRHPLIILTTHEDADADGLGAEIVGSRLLRSRGREFRVLNASPTAERFAFIDREGIFETWDEGRYGDLLEKSALLIMDTCDEYHLGPLRKLIPRVREVFAVDHHEPNPLSAISGLIDPSAAATCEIMVEIAQAAGLPLDRDAALAAFAGISYDSGSFAYRKTSARTFRAALALVEAGVNPQEVHEALNETGSRGALLLQKRVFSSLEIHGQGRIAVQTIRKEDMEATGAHMEDVESFVNLPLRSRDIRVSVMLKENSEGLVRCSLRSRGAVNVARIAREFGGGGHVSAAGFKSSRGLEETLALALEKLDKVMEPLPKLG
jgi:phosphoesterase RecJ-like protein